MAGVSDGGVLTLEVTSEGQVQQAESTEVAEVAAELHGVVAGGVEWILCHANRSAIVQIQRGKMVWRALSGGGSVGGGIHSMVPVGPLGEGGLAWLGLDGVLRRGVLEPEHALRWETYPIGETPRRVFRLRGLKCVLVATEACPPLGDPRPDFQQHRFRLYEEAGLGERGPYMVITA